ncbi:MAG: rhomboid family intramembrane serine protease [Gammaproteobacteria bacterium]|nr:MAG: rhomboid family intramembrane serine protease [Gammaproteobacteria bacterium]
MALPNKPMPWCCIQRAQTREPLMDSSLVLAAVDIDHHVESNGDEWCLYVPLEMELTALEELQSYQLENVPKIVHRPKVVTFDSGWFGVLGYLTVIWLLPSLEAASVFDLDWRGAGRMQAGLVMDGQWWRTVTALTLHADLAHILANSLFGAVFGLFVGRYLGSGFGWLLVLLAGALGNGINAFIQPDTFSAIGASTATFAALGLVAAFVWRRGYHRALDWRRSFAPLFAAICLLAFTGVGGADGNTDVLGHFMGFSCGVALGLLAPSFDIRRLGISGQYLSGAAAFGLIGLAWALAGGA